MMQLAGFSYLDGDTSHTIDTNCRDLLDRWLPHEAWWKERLDNGVDPYCKFTGGRVGPTTKAFLRDGREITGINFASQDYLGLAGHPAVHRAAQEAIEAVGVHSAGSSTLMGNTQLSRLLEERLSAFTGLRECTVFPTGWGAAYGAVRALVRPQDHIVIDMLVHNSLREGATQATKNIHTFPHLSNTGVERRLARIRASEPNAGILVVTESLFSMDSDVPNLRELKQICRHYGATLLVDAAHDFGAIGPRGLGMSEVQNALDAPDILMGSFSKTFASNGGFVASNHPALKIALRFSAGPLTFTSALSPVQAAVVLKALDIVQSEEGAARRRRLVANATHLRNNLEQQGFEVLGQPSAVLPITLGGNAMSRLATRHMFSRGMIVNFVEYPAVARNACRWRVQLMADHTRSQLDSFTEIAVESRASALSQLGEPAMQLERAQIAAE